MFPGFTLFGKFISMYLVTAVIGIFTAAPFAAIQYKKRGGDDIDMIFVMLFAGLGTFFGMHILYGITQLNYFGILLEATDLLDFINRFASLFGGAVFYGGLIGGIVAGGIYVKRKKLPAGNIADCAAPAIALFHGWGRIGCFLCGCCYGVESDIGFVYEHSLSEAANHVRRFPVQLVEACFEFVLFAVLWLLLKRCICRARLLSLYLIIYPCGRFVLEFFRGDEIRGFFLGLSTSQLISIIVLAVGLVSFVAVTKKTTTDGGL